MLEYEVKKRIIILSENKKTLWTKELNLVSWNGANPKYDIREWDQNHEKMGKGVTLSNEEFAALKKIINSVE